MKPLSFFYPLTAFVIGSTPLLADPLAHPSEFNEEIIRVIQETRTPSLEFTSSILAFESSTDPATKASKWEDVVNASAEGFLATPWSAPTGGWKLLDFLSSGNLTVRDVQMQQSTKVSYTKSVAESEEEAVRLRGAGSLLLGAVSEGGQWAENLLLDLAQRGDDNTKLLAFWFTKHFAQDANTISWSPNWSSWQQAYTNANALGKAIILRNLTMLAVRKNEPSVASNIYLSALAGSDRELKAIALVYSDPALGSAITQKWNEIADNSSDPQLQALANEMKSTFGLE